MIPDAVRAWQAGKPLEIRRPQAVRPWQHVLEPLNGYLTLAQQAMGAAGSGRRLQFRARTSLTRSRVRDVVELARAAYGEGEVRYGDGNEGPHESAWLALDVAKAKQCSALRRDCRWCRRSTRTMAWYRAHRDGADARQLMRGRYCRVWSACGPALPLEIDRSAARCAGTHEVYTDTACRTLI